MYISEKPRPIDFYKEGSREMIIEVMSPNPELPQQLILAGGEEPEIETAKAPKKRAETWVQEETKTLINLRKQMDGLFNTSKSNKHLWEEISAKMREKGFDRSPTMCTDKWRNLLKEYKKAKHQEGRNGNCGGKFLCYKELDELLRDRSKGCSTAPSNTKILDSYIHFSDKGIEDASITFGPVEGGEDQTSFEGRVISVKWGDYTRRIGIDGSADAIKEAIKSAFRLRTQRAFWLEDEDQIIRSLDRDMPLKNYTLHLDEGIAIKVCLYDDNDRIILRTEEKTLYTKDDLCDFLSRRGLACLRELNGFRSIDSMDDLRSGGVYQGVRLLRD